MAKLTLIAELPNCIYLLKGYGQDSDKVIKTNETVECLASRAVQFIGSKDFKVELNADELKKVFTVGYYYKTLQEKGCIKTKN